MKTDRDLERQLASIDRRGYPAYKGLRGTYDFGDFELDIAHVQGDPFAAPSQLAVYVPGDVSGLPACCRDAAHRRTATEDLLVRRFSKEARARAGLSEQAIRAPRYLRGRHARSHRMAR